MGFPLPNYTEIPVEVPMAGERAGHPTTEMVVAANNRLAALGAVSSRQYRRRRGARRAL